LCIVDSIVGSAFAARSTRVEQGRGRSSCTAPPLVFCTASAQLPAARSTRVDQKRWRAPYPSPPPVSLRHVGSVAGSAFYTRRAGAAACLVHTAPLLAFCAASARLPAARSTRAEQGRWRASSTAWPPVSLRRVGSVAGGAFYTRRAGTVACLAHPRRHFVCAA